ncbi:MULTISPECIES: head-tail connector protein [unclassified Acinetobacter]|uniref:head-tail connector protein n=1 Tax=unclassified Acinetobacter TaxID=196816 RepID=UPI00124FC48D|nr:MULTISPECIES: head-tail connector protein [unclassified Acinetobacter]
MPLTVNDVLERLKFDVDDDTKTYMEFYLEASTEIVQEHVGVKFDPEKKKHQLAIVLLCEYYIKNPAVDKGLQSNGYYLPESVLAILNHDYKPLAI